MTVDAPEDGSEEKHEGPGPQATCASRDDVEKDFLIAAGDEE